MNYEKLTVGRFGLNLEEGKYKSITGARRAIGKTSSWSAREKESAQALANKHFEVEATPKAAKPSPVKPAAVAAPKVAKKAATAKKAAVKKVPAAAKVTGKDEVPDEATPSQEKQYVPKVERTPVMRDSSSPSEAIAVGEQVLGFLEASTKHLLSLREIHPTGDLTKAFAELDTAFIRAAKLVASSIPSTASPVEEALPPPRVSLPNPKQTPAVKPPPVKPTIETKSAPTEGPVVNLEAKMAPRANVESPAAPILPAPATPDSGLTPEEQKMADSLRNATPVSSFAGLPRPVVSPAD